LYSVRHDIFLAATRADEVNAPPAFAAAAEGTRAQESVAPGGTEATLKFERLDAGGYAVARAKVPGGWLIACGTGVTFYPDPDHEWDGSSAK
jgi:hypothetical protein